MDFIQNIRQKYNGLTAKQRAITDYLMTHPEDACYASLKEISVRTHSSEVSVLRTCAALGFDGYAQLKEAFRRHWRPAGQGSLPLPGMASFAEADEQVRVLGQIGYDESAALTQFLNSIYPEELFEEARDLLRADEVVIFGHDVSKVFADYFFHRLTFLRIQASSVLVGDGSTTQSILGRLRQGDHAIFLSFPPYYLPVGGAARLAAQQWAKVTVITDSASSPAVFESCRCFLCSTSTRFFYNSHTLVAVLINLIASCAAMEMGPRFDEIVREERAMENFMQDTAGTVR